MEFHVADAEDAPVNDLIAAVICFSSYYRFYKLSYAQRPVSRGLTFVPDYVSISILTITARLSLLLTSHSRKAISVSYDTLSL
jgi:hypothetical protein